MGWTSFRDYNPSESRADIIRREFSSEPSENNPMRWGFEYLSERGSTVYAVMYRENPSENTPRVYFGMVFMTSRKNGEFNYKDIGEECGPYQYDAPLKMVDMLDKLAPNPGGYAEKWRAAIRENHAKRKARQKIAWLPGMRVQFSSTGPVFEIIGPAGLRRGFHVRMADKPGCSIYRAPAARFSTARIV